MGYRVTDENPEDKYKAIERFSRDLTKMAANEKLDPVTYEIRKIN